MFADIRKGEIFAHRYISHSSLRDRYRTEKRQGLHTIGDHDTHQKYASVLRSLEFTVVFRKRGELFGRYLRHGGTWSQQVKLGDFWRRYRFSESRLRCTPLEAIDDMRVNEGTIIGSDRGYLSR